MIILYNPQSSANRKPILPFSLLAVGAVLGGEHPFTILDGNLEAAPLARLGFLIRENPGCILAMTVMPGPQLAQAVSLCRQLKAGHPDVVIVWGGYFPTQHWDGCLRSGFVDYVVRGHGEWVFLARLRARQEKTSAGIEKIEGLGYCSKGAEPISNALAPIPHPKDLPAMNLDVLPIPRYVRRTFLGSRTLGYHSSYGCPFFCNFCAVVNMVNGKWFPQTAEQVAENLQTYVQRWNVNGVEFYDNNFFVHEARTAEFAARIRSLDIHWWGESRIDTLLKYSPRSWEAMHDAGLRMVFMGAESGSAETLKRMNKGGTMSPEKTLEMARRMERYQIVPEFSFVMGNPPDPEGDIRETMEFIRKVKKVNPASEIIMYLYTPVPLEGDLYDEARADGFAVPTPLHASAAQNWMS